MSSFSLNAPYLRQGLLFAPFLDSKSLVSPIPPPPRNAYIIFSAEFRKSDACRALPTPEASRLTSEKWHSLKPGEKSRYCCMYYF